LSYNPFKEISHILVFSADTYINFQELKLEDYFDLANGHTSTCPYWIVTPTVYSEIFLDDNTIPFRLRARSYFHPFSTLEVSGKTDQFTDLLRPWQSEESNPMNRKNDTILDEDSILASSSNFPISRRKFQGNRTERAEGELIDILKGVTNLRGGIVFST
jgi:hypothetical protein